MGVGMNEASKLGGAIAAVGVASSMIGDEKNQVLSAGAHAQEENNRLELENKQDTAEQAILQGKQEVARDAFHEAAGNYNAAKELRPLAQSAEEGKWLDDEMAKGAKGMMQSTSDIAKAQQAFSVLQDKIDARNFMMENNQKAIARAAKWGGNR